MSPACIVYIHVHMCQWLDTLFRVHLHIHWKHRKVVDKWLWPIYLYIDPTPAHSCMYNIHTLYLHTLVNWLSVQVKVCLLVMHMSALVPQRFTLTVWCLANASEYSIVCIYREQAVVIGVVRCTHAVQNTWSACKVLATIYMYCHFMSVSYCWVVMCTFN